MRLQQAAHCAILCAPLYTAVMTVFFVAARALELDDGNTEAEPVEVSRVQHVELLLFNVE